MSQKHLSKAGKVAVTPKVATLFGVLGHGSLKVKAESCP